ncbi:acetyl/propionyl/methylcrotonyl-CoA carboxylase subunit alpha [Falsigemmobacter faecalis]|uniref:ATP-grasp domain-containing protein n=1 Tax=Falsigemmobacter faecalis TaxID=2488730 RepID=A0A3P3DRJ9_9RHOB|nr:biotin carboxylase N-terminal domain-containing protein [Falsigemmobacter faecalis]RRH76883.1 ATP-grasp domain-containing protein [Falsigemmobacter faecalis]
MFAKILIANRGEIACRIIETAHRMGVATVAVYSEADAAARHVALAGEAVLIGGPAPAESYLRGARLIEAALASGAGAIHPGYGFLSENPEFVEAVEAAGLVFIGPSASAIRAMGLKDAAKRLMAQAGVPVVPGWQGEDQDPAHLSRAAAEIGWPVLIKAVAGGGGKGMRKVSRAEDFADALLSAQGEARTAFGNPAVLIEKYITAPRHIEVQVFGDGTRAVHLFERDCSLQRRHQKVIEEAPAPGMTEAMRAAMGAAAVRAAEAIGYKGAGTIEFIVDGSQGLQPDRFWFMEMNTRLQVEHPVTEAITGVDLVEWQLRVAAGEPLPARQEDLQIRGHAFEARLYAEDVPAGFLPATGRLDHLRFPPGIRADSGVREGDSISPWYDPMIAKIITHGPTREIALRKLSAALGATEVAGSVTNLGFLSALAAHEGFARGEVDTGLIERDLSLLTREAGPQPEDLAAATLAAAGLWEGAAPLTGFALWEPLKQWVTLEGPEGVQRIGLSFTGPDRAEIDTGSAVMLCERRAGGWWIGGRPARQRLRRSGRVVDVFARGSFRYILQDPLDRAVAAGGGGNVTLSPMPGLVKAVFVRPGQRVSQGDRLAVLEAMKMEHMLTAGRDGEIAEVLVEPGSQVEAGAALITLAEEAE